jgi:hypothetical protein
MTLLLSKPAYNYFYGFLPHFFQAWGRQKNHKKQHHTHTTMGCHGQGWACHVINNFITWYYTQKITKLYNPGERWNQQQWLPFLQRHPYAIIFPPRPMCPWRNAPFVQWREGCQTAGGREQFLTTEKRTTYEPKIFSGYWHSIVKSWVAQTGTAGIPTPSASHLTAIKTTAAVKLFRRYSVAGLGHP